MFRLFKRIPILKGPSVRRLNLLANQKAVIGNYGFVINVVSGAYIGGLVVCFTSLYLLYNDANERQKIPFELRIADQVTAVKAINKDDILESPRFAVKHYKRLLIELAKQADPTLEVDETLFDVPVIPSEILIYHKSNEFSNFYIDIVLRYAKALLAKGQLEPSVKMLQKIIDDDELFFKLGGVDRLSECCRLLNKMSEESGYLQRALDLIQYSSKQVHIEKGLIQEDSRLTDELVLILNDMAFTKAKRHDMTSALNIYLSNLKVLTSLQKKLETGEASQVQNPFFNCDEVNVTLLVNEIKAHVAEILWFKGHRKSAILWNEEIIESIYFDHGSNEKVTLIAFNVLTDLVTMYGNLGNITSQRRCQKLLEQIDVINMKSGEVLWYDSFIKRFAKIIYNKGPLGILEKPLRERFGSAQRIEELEEFEEEDVE